MAQVVRKHFENLDGKLLAYTSATCCLPNSMDALFTIESTSECLWALQWRKGVLFVRRPCKCGKPFDRGHINACNLFENNKSYQNTIKSTAFQQDFKEVETKLQKQKNSTNYFCGLDFCLNHKKYKKFISYCNYLHLALL